MKSLDAAEILATGNRNLVVRDLVWITMVDRETNEPTSKGFWNDVRAVTISVRDGRTGATVNRDFRGIGNGLQVGPIPLTSDITVRTVDIELPHLDEIVELMVRGYDVRGAPMQIYRLYLDPTTRIPVASAKARFVGYVDGAPIVTPSENEEGSIKLHCVSTTRELTRTNPEVRSHESQMARTAGADDFYIDTGVVGEWDLAWGQNRGPIVGKNNSGGRTGPA